MKLFTLFCICGVALAFDNDESIKRFLSARRVKRIIGGDEVVKGDWPWLAHLFGKIPTTWWRISYHNYYCGASVVNKRWLVTAAHCFKAPNAPSRIMNAEHWHIKVGEVQRTHSSGDSIRSWWGRMFGQHDHVIWNVHAQQIVVHPDYNAADTWKHDIAMIKVDTDLPVGDSDPDVSAVGLAESSAGSWPIPGTSCYMKGWGCDHQGGPLKDVAQAVELPALHDNVCNQYYGTISSTRLCAGYNLENKGICTGDSGGPLVCSKDTGTGDAQWIQAGLASYTSASRPEDVPGVFTRISAYRDWIDKIIRENP